MTTSLEHSTEHQARARMVLAVALNVGPSHAYLFRGPRGAGKRAAARAFAAEILAAASGDPADARRRALLDPSPHPDLVWLAPSGAQHMVEAVRERVIRAAAYRPFEGDRRVFVIEAAEAMRDESQNALLKTLEEPPGFVHLILLSSEPAALLETIVSRCQPVEFAPLPLDAVEAALAGEGGDESGEGALTGGVPAEEITAAARLSAGDVELARLLLTDRGRAIRLDVERLVATALGLQTIEGVVAATAAAQGASADDLPPQTEVATIPWQGLLEAAEETGADAEAAAREALEEEAEAGVKRSARDIADEAKRVGRRRRTEVLDLGLALTAAWFRDLAATAAGAPEAAFNRDRLTELQSLSAGLDPSRARAAAELVQDSRRRLDLNVSEELALEALFYRLERTLSGE